VNDFSMRNTKVLSIGCPKCGGAIHAQESQWKCIQCSFSISAFDGTGQRQNVAEIEKVALEAGGKRRQEFSPEEAPSAALDTLLNDTQEQDKRVPPKLVPKAARPHPNYMECDGSRESPFVIHSSNTSLSAQIQREIIDGIYGQGTKDTASRFYSESRRGLPGNSDLCEHRFIVKGEKKSIWFDLYIVTRLVNDPELNRMKSAVRSKLSQNPEFARLQNEMRQKLGLPAQRQPKGCLGVVALFIGLFVLVWIFRSFI
jgi:hypothetical protein